MTPMYQIDPNNPAFDLWSWFNLVGAAGAIFWIVAYVFIVRRCFIDRSYGLPLVAICLNFAWEILASFVFPNPVALWHAFDRIWLLVDVVIVYQLLRWGRDEQRLPEVKAAFYWIVAGTFGLGVWGQYAFVATYPDRLGLVVAFGINLVMSVAFVFFFFDRRPELKGISTGGAICKMLGTLGTSIQCHYVVAMINPELEGVGFVTFLSASIFVIDLLYVGLVVRAKVGMQSQAPERARKATHRPSGAPMVGRPAPAHDVRDRGQEC